MDTSRKSSIARLLAVGALALTAVVLIVIVSGGLGGGGSSSNAGPTTSTQTTVTKLNGTKLGRFWTVKTGQTLDTIAHLVGTTAARLQTLNPAVDPQALAPGTRIRIRQR
jgi:LysM repeat protein